MIEVNAMSMLKEERCYSCNNVYIIFQTPVFGTRHLQTLFFSSSKNSFYVDLKNVFDLGHSVQKKL